MMNTADIRARLLFLAKIKKELTNSRKTSQKLFDEARNEKAKASRKFEENQKHIKSVVNQLCDIEGEQRTLLKFVTPEEKIEICTELMQYQITKD